MRVVLTVIGQDKVGIIAGVSNQNIMQGFFNMVLIADMSEATVSLQEAKDKVHALGERIGVEIRMQSEDIFKAMHRV